MEEGLFGWKEGAAGVTFALGEGDLLWEGRRNSLETAASAAVGVAAVEAPGSALGRTHAWGLRAGEEKRNEIPTNKLREELSIGRGKIVHPSSILTETNKKLMRKRIVAL